MRIVGAASSLREYDVTSRPELSSVSCSISSEHPLFHGRESNSVFGVYVVIFVLVLRRIRLRETRAVTIP